MPYVQRDASGKVCGVYAVSQPGYAEEFLEDGDATVAAFLNPPPPPVSVTPRQARIALLQAGLLEAVETKLKSKGRASQIAWEYATQISRGDPLMNELGKQLGLSDAAIDLLFKQAAAIQ